MGDPQDLESLVQACFSSARDLHAKLTMVNRIGHGERFRLQHFDIPSLGTLVSDSLPLVRMMQNSTCAISRLPMEVMAHIFSFLIQPEADSNDFVFPLCRYPSSYDTLYDLMTLQQVCRLWRDIIQTLPSLWRIIVFPNRLDMIDYRAACKGPEADSDGDEASGDEEDIPELTTRVVKCFTRRSKSHPLFVYGTTFYGLEAIAEEASRFKHLQIAYDMAERDAQSLRPHLAKALSLLHQPAPQLETLDLNIVPRNNNWKTSMGGSPLPMLFSGETPRLRKLRLAGFAPWTGNNFHSLTHICVTGFSHFGMPPSDIRELFELLRHSPGLEELYLTHLMPWIHSGGDTTEYPIVNETTVIRPGGLRRIAVSDCYPWQFTHLFSRLRIPSGASLSLKNIVRNREKPSDTVDVFALYHDQFENLAELHSMAVFRGLTATVVGPHGAVRVSPKPYEEPMSSLYTLTKCPYLQNIQHLWLYGEGKVDRGKDPWYQVLSGMPVLRTIHVHRRTATDILHALTPGFADEPLTEPYCHAAVICRKLQGFFMLGPWDKDMAYPDLLRCAEIRFSHGYPFKQVRVKHLSLYEEPESPPDWSGAKLDALRSYVETVEFNVDCPLMELPPDVNTRNDDLYWPRWDDLN
ncbi:hypothetical protein BXZ70DRAFT_1008615 [Cristinia sonorae]|uniref:F-box domain-containing protein n=1 Tax=Cristinia sonorae TaxID=1940300 RepID=A0A8K0XPM9_9AGAR|nr:hypothetical protein BXZ70DRAFT_1008615 [Cristinia sonorae]